MSLPATKEKATLNWAKPLGLSLRADGRANCPRGEIDGGSQVYRRTLGIGARNINSRRETEKKKWCTTLQLMGIKTRKRRPPSNIHARERREKQRSTI